MERAPGGGQGGHGFGQIAADVAADHEVFLEHGGVSLRLDDIHGDTREVSQHLQLLVGEFAGDSIHHAKAAERQSVGGEHGDARIEPDVRRSGDEWVAGEAIVLCGIGHDESRPVLENGMSTKRDAPVGLFVIEPVGGFEPLPVTVDEGNRAERGVSDISGQADEVVESRFRLCIEDLVIAQTRQTLIFLRVRRSRNGTLG